MKLFFEIHVWRLDKKLTPWYRCGQFYHIRRQACSTQHSFTGILFGHAIRIYI